ncbi:MAG: acyltransferase, partial [Planctomycetota bacterium]
MAESPHPSPPHVPALDGVRGVAVLLVVVYHAAYLASPTGVAEVVFATVRDALWCGVDLFFVLSGFLITRILLATVGSPRYFRSFYLRRTVRIFPLYYGVLLLLFVGLPAAAWLAGGPLQSVVDGETYQSLWSRQAWLWAYVQNFLQSSGPSQLPGLGHFWSLAIEEQFYLAWPAAVWLVGRGEGGWRRVAWLCGAIVIAAPALRWALLTNGAEPWAVFHLT